MPTVNKANKALPRRGKAMSAALACSKQTVQGLDIEYVSHAGLNARIIRTRNNNAMIEFLDADYKVMNSAFYPHIDEVMCFTPTSRIMTPQGPRYAGDLQVGDMIVTRDNGAKPLAWVGQKNLSLGSLICDPSLAPVTIPAGSLGDGQPEVDLTVSPNHRILVRALKRDSMMGAPEVLVSAQSLVGSKGIIQSIPNAVTYLHLMFEQHELVLSEGVWSESFQPTKAALCGVDSTPKAELFSLFPDLNALDCKIFDSPVRPEIKEDAAIYPSKRGIQNPTHPMIALLGDHSQMPRVDHGFASFGSRYKSKSNPITRDYGLVGQRED